MPGGYSAQDCVTRTCQKTMLMRSKISFVFVKDGGGPIGDGLPHGVVRKIAAVALSVRTPTLSPFFGGVLPLANSCAGSLSQQGNRPRRAHNIQMKPFLFGQITRLGWTYHPQHFIDNILIMHGGRGR